MREVSIERNTNETQIELTLNSGCLNVHTAVHSLYCP